MVFSVVSSRSLVVPGRGLGGVPLAAPWWRSLVGFGLRAGACRWRLRASSRSFAGAVVVVGFGSQASAASFASAWSGWCGLALAVRRFAGGVWGVSVPVAVPPASPALASAVPVLGAASWVRG